MKKIVMSLIGGVLFSWLLLVVPAMTTTTWEPTGGPLGVHISTLAIAKSANQTLYVGTYDAGVFKTATAATAGPP
jgi:hypothetical protein